MTLLYIQRQRLRGLRRFHEAHRDFYHQALEELTQGKKRTHWVWYIFPQPKGLGHSVNALIYALSDREAKRYWRSELYTNSFDCAQWVWYHYTYRGKSLREIFGSEIDALKFRSFLSLFAQFDPRVERMRAQIDGA